MRAQVVRNETNELFLCVQEKAGSAYYFIEAIDEAPQNIVKLVSKEFELDENWDKE